MQEEGRLSWKRSTNLYLQIEEHEVDLYNCKSRSQFPGETLIHCQEGGRATADLPIKKREPWISSVL